MAFGRRRQLFQVWAITETPFHDEFPVTDPMPRRMAEGLLKIPYPGVVYVLRPEGYEYENHYRDSLIVRLARLEKPRRSAP